MRIAILGASHWHVRLMYIEALKKLGEEIVAVADRTPEKVALVADMVDCQQYTDYEQVIAEQQRTADFYVKAGLIKKGVCKL